MQQLTPSTQKETEAIQLIESAIHGGLVVEAGSVNMSPCHRCLIFILLLVFWGKLNQLKRIPQMLFEISDFKYERGSGIFMSEIMTALFPKIFSILLLSSAWSYCAFGDAANGPISWRSLTYVQNAIGVTNYVWNGDSLCFSNHQDFVRFYPGRRKSEINGTTVWLNALPDGSVANNNWRLAGIDLDFLQLAELPREEGPIKPVRVLLDPGHGGDDEGASSNNPVVKEKDLTLTLAKRIGGRLKKAGLQVEFTRARDITLTLEDRTRIARNKKADLLVSIHANHAENTEACGVETYILPPNGYAGTAEGSRPRGWQIGNRNDYHNTLLGFSVHQKLTSSTNTIDRGLKRQSFFVLRETSCPAVLLECGFLSNPGETRKMLETTWQERCAASVTEGILTYAKKVDALDAAVAEKRSRDAEANERWRLYLAAQSAHAADEKKATVKTVVAPTERPDPSFQSQRALSVFSNTVASASSVAITGTNAAPVDIDSLLDFYGTGKVH